LCILLRIPKTTFKPSQCCWSGNGFAASIQASKHKPETVYKNHESQPTPQIRPVTSLGRQVGRRVFWEGLKFFTLRSIDLNFVQNIFPVWANIFLRGGLAPPGYGPATDTSEEVKTCIVFLLFYSNICDLRGMIYPRGLQTFLSEGHIGNTKHVEGRASYVMWLLRGRTVWKAVGPPKKIQMGPFNISKHLGSCALFRTSCKLAPW